MSIATPERIEVNQEELESILAIVKVHLTSDQYKILSSAIKLIVWLQLAIKEKAVTIAKLKHMFFGKKTESYKNIKKQTPDALKDKETQSQTADESSTPTDAQGDASATSAENTPKKPDQSTDDPKQEKRKGHGRRSLNDYDFSKITCIIHGTLKVGDVCPLCGLGKVYDWDPEAILVFKGQSPIRAEAYCAQGLRCNKCDAVFRAKFPKEVITQSRADFSSRALACLAKYQLGTPLHRLERWQNVMNVPISDAELWEWTESVALVLFPVYKALIRVAAKGEVIHNDDTSAKILELMAENDLVAKKQAENELKGVKNENFRKGIYTSVLLSKVEGREIVFYCTGRKNAGENLDDLLDHRSKDLPKPVQSCDASTSNAPERHKTEVAKCFFHARHNFCELLEVWPQEALTAIEMINTLFMNDRKTKAMTPEERLQYHQKHSASVLKQLYQYCNDLIKNNIVEPNSGFGKAINYLNNHKEGLSLFLKNGLAPLSNNSGERSVKAKVLIRKNSYFYKSTWGAFVGDILLGVIKTCTINKINPHDYLIAIQANVDDVEKNPDAWLPWNYTLNVSCPYVKPHPMPVIEIYQPNGPPIIQPAQVDLESQKRTFREKVRDFFKQFRPQAIVDP